MSLKVKMSAVNENPFYGKAALKNLLNTGKTINSKSQMDSLLNSAWNEAKNDKTLREMFFIICFSIGDITNRKHNIFQQDVDNGGEACRPQMMWILSWIRKNQPVQYYKFMFNRIITEFISWFAILAGQVRTTKGKKNIDSQATETYSALKEHDLNKVAEFIADRLKNGSLIDKIMLAKWLVKPRLSKRQKVNRTTKEKSGTRDLQAITKDNMQTKVNLYRILSELMNWEVIYHPKNIQFKGLENFKKEYNQNLESVLFSTKQICNLDKEQFFKLLNECPSGARYRIQRRLFNGEGQSKQKWFSYIANEDLAIWFKEWENFKEVKQQEQRDLTEKVRQGTATTAEKKQLQQVKKEAKVTTGAVSLMDQLKKLMYNQADNLVIQSIMDKIKFEVPVLVVSDCSGSMSGLPTWIARLLTTVTMLKNPSPDLDNLLVRFGSSCEFITDNSKGTIQQNRFMTSRATVVDKLIDRTKDFTWNFNNLSKFVNSNMGGTYFSTVSEKLTSWINEIPEFKQHRIEQLQQYPVIVVVSDGDMNSDYSAGESMNRFMNGMRQLGWNGVVVVWNVKEGISDNYSLGSNDKFANVPNCIHYYGYNLGIINQIFTNIHDLDVIDVYQDLKSLHASNRYQIIKENVI